MSKGFTHQELLIYIVPIGIAAGIALGAINTWSYNRLYDRAEAKAELTIGDKKHPLDEQEFQDWYNRMSVPDGKIPKRRQLHNFLENLIE